MFAAPVSRPIANREKVFMTRKDLACVHEPFGDAFYYGFDIEFFWWSVNLTPLPDLSA